MRRILCALTLLCLAVLSGCSGPRTGPSRDLSIMPLAPGLTLTLTTAPFDSTRYAFRYDDMGYPVGTVGCDTWHGTGGGLPDIVIQDGWVDLNGQRYGLDTSCMATCEFCSFDGAFWAEPLGQRGTWSITGQFSDGAGTAEVVWIVGPGGATRVTLVSGPELIDR